METGINESALDVISSLLYILLVIRMMSLKSIILIALCVAQSTATQTVYASIIQDASKPRGFCYVQSETPLYGSSIVWGSYVDAINSTGWATLHVNSNASYTDDLQAYAAGYLEGAVSQAREYLHINNVCSDQTWENGLREYLDDQWTWMRTMVTQHAGTSPYWYHVGLLLDQQQGLFDGYNNYAPDHAKLDWLTFYCATLSGDLDDLNSVFPQPEMPKTSTDGHCSVLVKPIGPLDAPTDVFIGHNTWGGFNTMTRIYKFYDLPFATSKAAKVNADSQTQRKLHASSIVPGRRVAFSSYPATLFR